LEERFTYRELDCFLGVGNNDLNEDSLVDKAIRDMFALFWEAMAGLEVEAFPCFQKWDLRASFSACLVWWCLQSHS